MIASGEGAPNALNGHGAHSGSGGGSGSGSSAAGSRARGGGDSSSSSGGGRGGSASGSSSSGGNGSGGSSSGGGNTGNNGSSGDNNNGGGGGDNNNWNTNNNGGGAAALCPKRTITSLFKGTPEALVAVVEGQPAAVGAAIVEGLHWLGLLRNEEASLLPPSLRGALQDPLFFVVSTAHREGQMQVEALVRTTAAVLHTTSSLPRNSPAAASALERVAERLFIRSATPAAAVAEMQSALRGGGDASSSCIVPAVILPADDGGSTGGLALGYGQRPLQLLYWLVNAAIEARGGFAVAVSLASLATPSLSGSSSSGIAADVANGDEEGCADTIDDDIDIVAEHDQEVVAGESVAATISAAAASTERGRHAAPPASRSPYDAALSAAALWRAEAARLAPRLSAADRHLAERYHRGGESGKPPHPSSASSSLLGGGGPQLMGAGGGAPAGVDWRGHVAGLGAALRSLGPLVVTSSDGGRAGEQPEADAAAANAGRSGGQRVGGRNSTSATSATTTAGVAGAASIFASLLTLAGSCATTIAAVEKMELKWNPPAGGAAVAGASGDNNNSGSSGSGPLGVRLMQELQSLVSTQRALALSVDASQHRVSSLSGQLQRTVEEAEVLAEEMSARTERMSSTAPLQEIRAALGKIRRESLTLELHIGVGQQQLSRRTSSSGVRSTPSATSSSTSKN